jgi:CRP-like cAMP-binding protein
VLFVTARHLATGDDPVMASRNVPTFARRTLLDWGTTPTVEYRRAELIFSPGDAGDSVMYIQRGGVKLSVISASGREAVVAVLGRGEFLGEACLAGERTRTRRAIAVARSTLVVVGRGEMRRVLRRGPVAERLLSHVLVRQATMERALIDQFFSSAEQRLARALLLLARYGTGERPRRVLKNVSDAMLADLVGETPARISALMERFEQAGFIQHDGHLVIKRSLLSVVLRD